MKKAMDVLALPVRMSKSVDGVVMGLRHGSTTHVAEKLCSRSIQVLTSGRVMVLYFSTMVGLNFSHTSSGILGAFERLPTMNVAMFGSGATMMSTRWLTSSEMEFCHIITYVPRGNGTTGQAFSARRPERETAPGWDAHSGECPVKMPYKATVALFGEAVA